MFTVTKFDRSARNAAEANDIRTALSGCGVLFALGPSVYSWNDPFGWLFLQDLAVFAGFEADLGHTRTREGMTLPNKNGKLNGEQLKLPEPARRHAEGNVSLAASPPNTASDAPRCLDRFCGGCPGLSNGPFGR